MNVLHKVSAALLAIVGLTTASDSMAYCQTGKDLSWWGAGPTYVTLSCAGSGDLATFELNTNGTSHRNARMNLLPGKHYAQIVGYDYSGNSVSGCLADDMTPNNVPAYLNWGGWENPSCSGAFIAHMVAAG
jgi:hypothetical protein